MKYLKTYLEVAGWDQVLEGAASSLVLEFPELELAWNSGIKNYHHLNWIRKRGAGEPVRDIIGVIKSFLAKRQQLKAAGFSTDISGYSSAGEMRDALEQVGPSRGQERGRLKRDEAELIAEFGDWQVWLPVTTEASCELGKATRWCTSATQSENLFTNYILNEEVVLYYVIRKGVDSRKDPSAKLSIGWSGGELALEGEDGWISVDAANKGLNRERLQTILAEKYRAVLNAITKHYQTLPGAEHPLKGLIKAAASPQTSAATLAKLAETKELEIIWYIAANPNTPAPVLIGLMGQRQRFTKTPEDSEIFDRIARNPNLPLPFLMELIEKPTNLDGIEWPNWLDSLDQSIKIAACQNPALPIEVLNWLSNHTDPVVRENIKKNPRFKA